MRLVKSRYEADAGVVPKKTLHPGRRAKARDPVSLRPRSQLRRNEYKIERGHQHHQQPPAPLSPRGRRRLFNLGKRPPRWTSSSTGILTLFVAFHLGPAMVLSVNAADAAAGTATMSAATVAVTTAGEPHDRQGLASSAKRIPEAGVAGGMEAGLSDRALRRWNELASADGGHSATAGHTGSFAAPKVDGSFPAPAREKPAITEPDPSDGIARDGSHVTEGPRVPARAFGGDGSGDSSVGGGEPSNASVRPEVAAAAATSGSALGKEGRHEREAVKSGGPAQAATVATVATDASEPQKASSTKEGIGEATPGHGSGQTSFQAVKEPRARRIDAVGSAMDEGDVHHPEEAEVLDPWVGDQSKAAAEIPPEAAATSSLGVAASAALAAADAAFVAASAAAAAASAADAAADPPADGKASNRKPFLSREHPLEHVAVDAASGRQQAEKLWAREHGQKQQRGQPRTEDAKGSRRARDADRLSGVPAGQQRLGPVAEAGGSGEGGQGGENVAVGAAGGDEARVKPRAAAGSGKGPVVEQPPERPEVVPPSSASAHAARNDTKTLVDVKVGMNSLVNIETEVEKHVGELLALFSAEQGGRKFQTAALGVQQEVEDIRHELVKLLKTINSTNQGILGAESELLKKDAELLQLHAIEEVEGAKDKLDGGNMKVDYATGKIRWDEDAAEGAGPGAAVVPDDGNAAVGALAGDAREADTKGGSEWRKEVERMTEEWDPALLHLNPKLLWDFVILCISTALGGVTAAGFGMPETLGYIVGGMVVGPSGANLIRMVKEVETFAQFGSIFLLFGHGLMYSTFFNAAAVSASVYAPQGRMGALTVLFVVFSALLVCAAMMGIHNAVESVFLSAAATLSSTAMVTEFVAHRRLGDTVFARMVVDLVAVQDLVMCPLLAVPTAIIYAIRESDGTGAVWPQVLGCAILLVALVVASRTALPLVMQRLVLKDKEKEQSSGLFTLGVVSYCLGVALVCERLSLSHEVGALFAGLLMVDSPFAKKAHACMQPLTSLFGGMYLGSLGMIVNPAFMVYNFGQVVGCVLLLVTIKFIIVAVVMKSFGYSWEASTLAGACMAQVSEISLFFVARAQHLQLVGRHHYLVAVAATIVLMVASPAVITALQTYHGGSGATGSGGGSGAGIGPGADRLPGGGSGFRGGVDGAELHDLPVWKRGEEAPPKARQNTERAASGESRLRSGRRGANVTR